MKYLILSTRQNAVWLSMQEIIPGIEELWTEFAQKNDHQIQLLNVDQKGFLDKECLSYLLGVDMIIVTAFNTNIARALIMIREKFKIDAPWIIYLHNQATIGCWPFFHWGLTNLLHQADQFISTCSYDQQIFGQLFKEKKSHLIPFHLPQIEMSEKSPDYGLNQEDKNFVYVGRISEQKNIHSLIYAFSLNQGEKAKLHLFGSADHLGSPNMEAKQGDYEAFLHHLTQQLNLKDKVIFHGHKPRHELYAVLGKTPHIFVSASLHSDENFGMAALRSLTLGAQGILSHWGGHADFLEHFPKQVKTFKVYHSSHGPFINPHELADLLKQATAALRTNDVAFYQKENIFSLLSQIKDNSKRERLIPTELSQMTYDRRNKFSSALGYKIFADYQDELAHLYFRSYGACDYHPKEFLGKRVPWVNQKSEVSDPHRGKFKLATIDELKDLGYIF